MVSRLRLARKYGSRAALAIIEPRQLAPMDTSSPEVVVRLLWQAWHSSDELKSGPTGRRPCCHSAARGRWLVARERQHHARRPRDGGRYQHEAPYRHRQNSRKLPSNQSHSR